MVHCLSFSGRTAPRTYLLVAPALLLSQHLAVLLIFNLAGWPMVIDVGFFLLPLRKLAVIPDLSTGVAAAAFTWSLLIAWGLALLSLRRARWSGVGYPIVALTIVPGVQIAAVILVALLPRFGSTAQPAGENAGEAGMNVAHVIQGVLAGVAVIVLAVLVSAVTFGAYGWGLFVMTPLLVGISTGYLANRGSVMSARRTSGVVLVAAALGTVSLVMVALEGALCILLAAPLGAVAAAIGGAIGRAFAWASRSGRRPLMSVAFLPAVFALEAAMPPSAPIASQATIDIDASPAMVWSCLVSSAPIATGPGLIGLSGLAFPIRGRLVGTGVGAIRLGEFSTGTAIERVTTWLPRRELAFIVLRQPRRWRK